MSQKEAKDLSFEVCLYFNIKQANQSKGNLYTHFRSSCLQMFFRIGVLKNFAIFTGQQLCLQLYKTETPMHLFSCEYCKIFKNSYFLEHFSLLLLSLSFKFFPIMLKLTSIKIKNVYSFSSIALQVLPFTCTKNVKC